MKIKSIYIDGLHNAVNEIYGFGDIVYIFGNNGVGKSTILQAIQFALLGYIPGTAKNSKEALLRHSPKGEIVVILTLDDVTITRKLIRKGDKDYSEVITQPVGYDISTITNELELPIFNFSEFVGQTANKLKEYFIKNILPTANGDLDWRQILTDSVADCNFADKDAIIDYGMSVLGDLDGSVLDQVVEANSKFKADQSFNKSELQRLQNTVDSLIYYDDYVGSTDPVALNTEILACNALRDQAIKYETAVSATKSSQEELSSLEHQITVLGGREGYDYCVKSLDQLNGEQDALSQEINTKREQLAALNASDSASEFIINSKGICPYTKGSCKSILSEIDNIRNNSAAAKATKVELTQEIQRLEGEIAINKASINNFKDTIAKYENTWNRIDVLEKTVGEIPERPNTDKSVPELTAEIDRLTLDMTKLQANIQYNDTIESLTAKKFDLELRGSALSKWVKITDTNGLQTTLMQAPFEELSNTLTGYIQNMYGRSDIKAHFNISTKANSFSFGLIRNYTYIPYDMLSSGEKCLYSLALMICIVNHGNSPLKLLLCDDMFDHLDSSAIENTFAALKGIKDIQFIFAGVKDCKNAQDVMLKLG